MFIRRFLTTRLSAALAVLALFAFVAGTAVTTQVVTATEARADGCYTWNRDLSEGASGEDVRQLQMRVAGYPGYGARLVVDGEFGPLTKAAVQRFQTAYGLSATGTANAATYTKIYALQDDDCTPIHFTYAELDNGCGSGFSGGPLSAAATKANALRTMWHLEALRHALGDQPLVISSGFRDIPCNRAAGGTSDSQHLYGRAADATGVASFCRIAQQARNHGFGVILGPGYSGHNDHIHLDIGPQNFWSAPNCGI